jgi:Uma2 family endonuclease
MMVTIEAAPKRMTLDEFLKLDDDARIEIIDGEIVEIAPLGVRHHLVINNVHTMLRDYVSELEALFLHGLHYLMNSPNLENAFVPDVSFIRTENIPLDWDIEKPFPGVPTLAIEVISPGDDAEKVQAKVRTYLDEGTEQVWLMYPKTREVHQFINGKPETVRIYKKSETIDASALFPAIEGLTVESIFKLPTWANKERKSDG